MTISACVFLLAGCSGGGNATSPTASVVGTPLETPRVSFAPGNSGHYDTGGLPSVDAGDARHMPIWRDSSRLGVGVDQGARHLRGLPTVGRRDGTDIRHGRLNDGVGGTTLRSFLDDTSAGQSPQRDLVPPVTVSWDSSASTADRQRIIRAVQAVNVALPEARKMTIAARGSIPISFLDETEYDHRFGDGWGIALYGGGIVINRAYSGGGDRQAIILLSHELMHKLEFEHPPHSDYNTIIEAGVNAEGYGTIYDERQGIPQPLSLLYPIDREALRNLYGSSRFGPWESTALHVAGHGRHAAFGVALRNGYAEPWAFGYLPESDLSDNQGLSGTATWVGTLLGLTPAARAVAGDAEVGVNLASLTGRADFTGLETWTAHAAPGEAGSGTRWLDGDLGYAIVVNGNGFRETGGDAGRLTGIFTGRNHEGAAGTLERNDLVASFGAAR